MKIVKNSWFFLIGLFFMAVYLLPLNSRLLWQPDETRYAEISREMLQRGDWVVPHLLGLRYFEKPVAGYWINNISQWLFGENNFAVRFGSAFSIGLSAVLVYFLAWLMWRNRKTAVLASLIFLSMLLVMGVGTYSVLDPMISLWLTAAMVSFYLTLKAESVKGKIAGYLLLGLTCGMGFLTKGFLALAVPVIAVLPIMIQQRRLKELFVYGPLAILSALLISLPWVIAVALREPDYWHYFFWVEHIQRFALEDAQHKQPFWYYLPMLCLSVVPWLALLPGALLSGWQQRKTRPELFFLLSWVIMPLLFFSLAKGKLITYILPCMAPLALLMAFYAQQAVSKLDFRSLRINGILNFLFGLICIVVLLYIGIFSPEPIFAATEQVTFAYGLMIFASWMLLGAYAAGKGTNRWLISAACPVVFALLVGYAIPQQIVDSKLPQNFIDAHKATLQESRYIVADSVGMAPAIAWELKRSDIFLYDEKGEVAYGLSYPDAQGRLIDKADFSQWLAQARQTGNVSLVLKLNKTAAIPANLPTPDQVQQQGRLALLWYKMQP